MKRALTNGILLDGTEQMEPVRGKALLTENDKITAIADAGATVSPSTRPPCATRSWRASAM